MNVVSDIDWENIPVRVDPWLARYLRRMGTTIAAGDYPNIMAVFPQVQFYDYTKVESRIRRYRRAGWPANYHLTWSLAETPANRRVALDVLRDKVTSVSVPFALRTAVKNKRVGDPLPAALAFIDNTPGMDPVTYAFPVIDADKDDARFYDVPGTIAGLRFKPSSVKVDMAGARKGERPQAFKMRKAVEQGFVVPATEPVRVYRAWRGEAQTNPRYPFTTAKSLNATARALRRIYSVPVKRNPKLRPHVIERRAQRSAEGHREHTLRWFSLLPFKSREILERWAAVDHRSPEYRETASYRDMPRGYKQPKRRNPRWEDMHGPEHEAFLRHINSKQNKALTPWEPGRDYFAPRRRAARPRPASKCRARR